MKSQIPKWGLALIFGLIAIGGAVQSAFGDGRIDAGEWVAIVNAFMAAAWAKYSNPEKVVSPKPTEFPK